MGILWVDFSSQMYSMEDLARFKVQSENNLSFHQEKINGIRILHLVDYDWN